MQLSAGSAPAGGAWHGDHQHPSQGQERRAEAQGRYASSQCAGPPQDGQVGSTDILPPHADDSDKSILSIKKLNQMTTEQVHTFIDIPGLDMNMFDRLKKLDFQNWAGACPSCITS